MNPSFIEVGRSLPLNECLRLVKIGYLNIGRVRSGVCGGFCCCFLMYPELYMSILNIYGDNDKLSYSF